MNIHRKMCILLSFMFVISTIVFCCARQAHPTISSIFIAVLTGAFLSMCTTFVNYLHEKEEFFNNLFFTGVFVNANYENIKQFINYLDNTSNLKYAITWLKGYSNTIDYIIKNINFDKYSPFCTKTKIAKLVEEVRGIYNVTLQSIVILIARIEVSSMKSDNLNTKLNFLVKSCGYCNLQPQEQPSSAQCHRPIEYQNSVDDLKAKIEAQDNKTKELIKTLYENTVKIQTGFLSTMNCLHCKSKNKTRWEETINANKEYTSRTMKDYVQNLINRTD